jgi:hypothetical protein
LAKWGSVLPALCDEYRTGRPSPHICLAEFLAEDLAEELALEPVPFLPDHGSLERMWPISQRASLPLRLGRITDELNSPQFLVWLSDLTGVSQLVADPAVFAGGLRQYDPGESLNFSSSAATHPLNPAWCRRVVLVLYLTPHWQQEWRGAMELSDSRTGKSLARYPSLFNHALIFSADDGCLFGFSDPLRCPRGVSQRSLVLYYYTVEGSAKHAPGLDESGNPPGDGWSTRAFSWLRRSGREGNFTHPRKSSAAPGLARRVLSFPSKRS